MNRPTLATLLAQRPLRPGEAVTVLVPLLQTLNDLHRLDCTHGHVSADAVVFDASGRPTFGEWQHCVEHGRGDALPGSFRPAMLADCHAFAELARLVLSRTQPPFAGSAGFLQAPLSRLVRGRREPFVRECEAELFALADAEPVDLPVQSAVPTRWSAGPPGARMPGPACPSGGNGSRNRAGAGGSGGTAGLGGGTVPRGPVGLGSGTVPGGATGSCGPLESGGCGSGEGVDAAAAMHAYDWGAQTSGALATIAADVDEWERTDREAARPRARLRAWVAHARSAAGWGSGRSAHTDVGPHGALLQTASGRRALTPGWRTRRVRLFAVAAIVCVCAVGGALFAVPPGGSAKATGVAGSSNEPPTSPRRSSSESPSANAAPTTGGSETPAGSPTPGAGPARGASSADGSGPAAGSPGDGGSIGAGDSARGGGGLSAADAAAVAGADAVVAGGVLLRLRDECLRSASENCLDGVDQLPSAAFNDDRGAIAAKRPGGAAVAVRGSSAGDSLRLVQSVGATALLEVIRATPANVAEREPASLLLVKGEAGWRIREVFNSE